ncbi:MAG: hypothetical protein EON59_03840 [Alphaproteobacteria bacterium]|nr:MAG: hypothetical protein EON59_03840 [Alphaproteobacteria bacterium]
MTGASPSGDRAFAAAPPSPQAVSPVPASIPSACHTPPPWLHKDDSNSPNHRHSIVAMGKTVAHIYCTKGDEVEDAANAKLIAQAHNMGGLLLMYSDLDCSFGVLAGCGGMGTPPCRGCMIRNVLTDAGLL